MDYEKAWKAMREYLVEMHERYDFPNNPKFDPMMMALHAEIGQALEAMDEQEAAGADSAAGSGAGRHDG